jgi:hypothetical protein
VESLLPGTSLQSMQLVVESMLPSPHSTALPTGGSWWRAIWRTGCSGTWPDKHYDKNYTSPLEQAAVKKFNMGLAIIDKGLTVFGELDKNRVPTLVTVVVAERADLEMRYDGLLLYELGMHMLMMGPNLGKQLMDAKNQLVQTAEELLLLDSTAKFMFEETGVRCLVFNVISTMFLVELQHPVWRKLSPHPLLYPTSQEESSHLFSHGATVQKWPFLPWSECQ